MRQFALDSGFNSAAVVTNLKTLNKLKDCQIILYLPDSKHYIVLENIDSKYVWLIDLDSNKFYYRISVDDFEYLWNNGVALLISDQSFDLGEMTEISDDDLKDIKGSTDGGIPNYSCTDLIQSYDIDFCPPASGGQCGGRYWQSYNRYGCIEDESGDKCLGTDMLGKTFSPCTEDIYNPGVCTITGNWFSRYMRACK